MQNKYMGYTASKLIGTAGLEMHHGEFHIVSSLMPNCRLGMDAEGNLNIRHQDEDEPHVTLEVIKGSPSQMQLWCLEFKKEGFNR
jgi:hypothetical protein